MKYKKIVEMRYTTGIYDRCSAGLAVRSDGKRARVWYDGIRWLGNTGRLHRWIKYVDLEKARKILRAYRCAKATYELGNGRGYSPYDVLANQLTSNWIDTEPHIGID